MNFKLKVLKNVKLVHLAAVLAVGVIMLVLANFQQGTNPKVKKDEVLNSDSLSDSAAEDAEKRLSSVVSKIKGVSNVSVFITYENSGVKKTGANTKENVNSGKESSVLTKENTAVMKREASCEEPFISEEKLPQVRGVLIVARGVDDPYINSQITEAVSTVLGVAVHKVKILPSD